MPRKDPPESEIYARLVERFLLTSADVESLEEELQGLTAWRRGPTYKILAAGGPAERVLGRLIAKLGVWSDDEDSVGFLIFLRHVYLALENPLSSIEEIKELWLTQESHPGYQRFIHLFLLQVRENLSLPRSGALDEEVLSRGRRIREMIRAIFAALHSGE